MQDIFEEYFSVQVFLIILRETLESAIIISVLLAFIKQSLLKRNGKSATQSGYQTIAASSSASPESLDADSEEEVLDLELYKRLRFQIWTGGVSGLLVCLLLGGVIIVVFYSIGSDLWSLTEHYWEGFFSIFASVVISVMGLKILRVNKMQEKWKRKLSFLLNDKAILNRAIKNHKYSNRTARRLSASFERQVWGSSFSQFHDKYAMFILPFITTLREGMEAVVFIGGVNLNQPASSIPFSTIAGLLIGISVGLILYRSGNSMSLQVFLILSTQFLYLVAAGLFSKGVWNLELQQFINACGGLDVSETGSGPGSYDIFKSVWHVNCCNGETDGGWVLFSAIFGWTNSATYGSVISYNVYWIVIIVALYSLTYEERNGRLPFVPIKWQLKRINKRVNFTQSTNEALSISSETRESIDSINSVTPLRPN